MTLRNDLGTFEGFSFRHQSAIFPNLSAQDVIDWDHDNQGEAEFWPSGDHSGVRVTLGNKSSVTATEIKILDELINDLGDTTEAYLKIRYATQVLGKDLFTLTVGDIEDMNVFIFSGTSFTYIYRDAGYELFELYYPELYKLWEQTPCDGLTFDPRDFLESPSFTLDEVTLSDNDKWLIVHPD